MVDATMGNPRKTILMSALILALAGFSSPALHAQTPTDVIDIAKAPIPIQVLVQTETKTDMQVICLFRSSPVNTLHGSLAEIDEKLKGLLDRIRKPDLFRGELGETLLIAPPAGGLGARKLLIIGLGDPQTFSPQRMDLVGEILYAEAARLGVAHPYFAPTILGSSLALCRKAYAGCAGLDPTKFEIKTFRSTYATRPSYPTLEFVGNRQCRGPKFRQCPGHHALPIES
jgi:hypothetical protein